jgi:hypothetical protein
MSFCFCADSTDTLIGWRDDVRVAPDAGRIVSVGARK